MIDLLSHCQTFFFAPIHPRRVRVFAILTALLVAYIFRYWEPYGAPFDPPLFQAWYQIANTYVYRGLLLMITAAFIVGFRPRLTGLILAALLFPIMMDPIRQQSRQILFLTLICLALLDGGKSSRDLPMWPIRLIQLQMSLVYGVNALAKMSPEYLSGDVLVGMSMTLPNFLADMADGYYRVGPLAIPAAAAAWGSVLVESFLAIGFWFPPLRWIAAGVGILFHLQLKTIIHIGMLDWVSMFLYLSFIINFKKDPPDGPLNQNS